MCDAVQVLYRGFLLPALYLYFPPKISTPFRSAYHIYPPSHINPHNPV
jgi:hypothetical protein